MRNPPSPSPSTAALTPRVVIARRASARPVPIGVKHLHRPLRAIGGTERSYASATSWKFAEASGIFSLLRSRERAQAGMASSRDTAANIVQVRTMCELWRKSYRSTRARYGALHPKLVEESAIFPRPQTPYPKSSPFTGRWQPQADGEGAAGQVRLSLENQQELLLAHRPATNLCASRQNCTVTNIVQV
jgi:hypothetical protein